MGDEAVQILPAFFESHLFTFWLRGSLCKLCLRLRLHTAPCIIIVIKIRSAEKNIALSQMIERFFSYLKAEKKVTDMKLCF